MPNFVTFDEAHVIDQSFHFRKFAKFEGMGDRADEKLKKED
jgi:hypothetical protein